MVRLARDPLLAAARAFILILMIVLAVGTIVCLIATPLIIVMQGRVVAEIGGASGPAPTETIGAVLLVLILGSAAMALGFLALRLLLRVIDTVAEGDPFVPVNGQRLTRMAWLMLGVQIVQVPLFAIATWLGDLVENNGNGDFTVSVDVDFTALVLVLMLLVLARVFRHGAQMREELEGTV